MELTIGNTLFTNAHNFPDLEALVIEGKRVAFNVLNEAVNRRARALLALGINRGDHVGTLSANSVELVETIYALARIGAVVVPLSYRLAADELSYVISHADISTLVFQDQFETTVREVKPSIPGVKTYLVFGDCTSGDWTDFNAQTEKQSSNQPDVEVKETDPATIICTSGTTGQPKGVVHTHKSWVWQMANLTHSLQSRFEKTMTVYPLFHAGGFMGLYAAIFAPNTLMMLTSFDPKLMLETIEKERINRMGNPPTVYKMLLQIPELAKTDLSSMRNLMSGSEVIPDETRNQLKRAFPGVGIVENYGSTEVCGVLTNRTAEFTEAKPFSVGRPHPLIRLRIVDETGRNVPPETVGEIVCCGPSVMQEYYKDPKKTSDAIRDGWLFTGDLGWMDADGFLYIKERKNHMIISGGENIYPKEVEDVLYRHPGIFEAAVFGLPDELWGEKVCAAIVTKPGEQIEAEEVVEFCKNNLASFKKPKEVYFVDALPKNQIGKILRSELKKQFSI